MTLNWEALARSALHPTRMELLELAMDGTPRSPIDMAQVLGVPVGRLSYHVRGMADAGLLTLVRTESRRGAIKHYYTVADAVLAHEHERAVG